MDLGTQQNAAMVEESTAASSILAVEANRLRLLVEQFRFIGNQRTRQVFSPDSHSDSETEMPNVVTS